AYQLLPVAGTHRSSSGPAPPLSIVQPRCFVVGRGRWERPRRVGNFRKFHDVAGEPLVAVGLSWCLFRTEHAQSPGPSCIPMLSLGQHASTPGATRSEAGCRDYWLEQVG